ncbi:MAG: PEP-CTERM system TPR-repeat protein PrsT, partial [Gammaproteobacteria bacterium]
SFSRKEYAQTAIQLKNALQLNPEFADARFLLGETLLELSDFLGAQKEFEKALVLGVSRVRVEPKLVAAYYGSGNFQKIDKWPLTGLGDSGQAEVLAYQGLGMLARLRLEEAKLRIDQAKLLDGNVLIVLLANVSLMNITIEPAEEVRKEISEIQTIHPQDSNSSILLGDLERREGNFDAAEINYTKAIDSGLVNFITLMKRASLRSDMNALEGAQKDIDQLLSINPGSPAGHFIQGVIHYKNKHYKDAIASFEIPLRDESRFQLALFYAGASHFSLNNLQQADIFAVRYFNVSPENIAGRIVLANVRFAQGHYQEVEDLLRPVVAVIDENPVALNLLGSALLNQGKHNEALYYLDRVTLLIPDSPQALLRYGVALSAAGDSAEAVNQIKKSIQKNPGYKEAYTVLVLNHLKNNEFDKAIQAANNYRDEAPDSVYPYNLLGQIYMTNERRGDAKENFKKAMSLEKGNVTAGLSLIDLAMSEQDFKVARAIGQEVLEVHSNDLSTLLKLAALDVMERDEKGMLQKLQAAIDAHPGAIKPRLITARYYLAKSEPAKAENVLGDFLQQKSKGAELLEVVASIQLAQSEYGGAINTIGALINKHTKSPESYYLLSRAYAGLDDYENMHNALNKVIELNKNHFGANLALAKYYSLNFNNELFEKRMSVLGEIGPDRVETLLMDAAHQSQLGNFDDTLALLGKAYNTHPTTETVLKLSRQQSAMGENQAALKLQRDWISANKNDVTVRLSLASLLKAMGEDEQVNQQYEDILAIDPQNVAALNHLAWVYRKTNPSKALSYAELAHKLLPDSWMVLDTYAVVLLHNGEIAKARRYIERALAEQANNPALQFHKAQIEYAGGNKSGARNTLETVLQRKAHFAERKEAEDMLAGFTD